MSPLVHPGRDLGKINSDVTKPAYCTPASSFDLPDSAGERIAVLIPLSAVFMTTMGLVSFKLSKPIPAMFLCVPSKPLPCFPT
jgi:hypothetical protein